MDMTGFHPRRNEFEPEWDNAAECGMAELDFREEDTEVRPATSAAAASACSPTKAIAAWHSKCACSRVPAVPHDTHASVPAGMPTAGGPNTDWIAGGARRQASPGGCLQPAPGRAQGPEGVPAGQGPAQPAALPGAAMMACC